MEYCGVLLRVYGTISSGFLGIDCMLVDSTDGCGDGNGNGKVGGGEMVLVVVVVVVSRERKSKVETFKQ